ncbi:MAG: hypothetical protein ABI981_12490 [Betaproteobacteria bacterium]
MRVRTLITRHDYYGMDAMALRAATNRILSRLAGAPGDAQLSGRSLRHDFAVDTQFGSTLVHKLVADGLLEADETRDEYRITDRFVEFATARVVDPLSRERARHIVARAAALGQRINEDSRRNPLEIEMIAPFGSYMSRDDQLAELPLGIVVMARAWKRRARWGRMQTRGEGAHEIRCAFRRLSSFVQVKLVSEASMLPRPFSVVFQER